MSEAAVTEAAVTEARKKGAHGGNMVSPAPNRPDWVRIPVAGILRLLEAPL